MNFSTLIFLAATLCCINGLSITNPAHGVSEVPVWPETLLEWTWGPGDPATVDIIIQYQFANTHAVNNYTFKANFPAEQRSVTIPWIPLGLDVGTHCVFGIVPVGDHDNPLSVVGIFTLVKASGDAPNASNYPSTIYTTTSASRTYIVTTTVGPIETGLSAASQQTTISTTASSTITYTVTSVTTNIDTVTEIMSLLTTDVSTGTMNIHSSPALLASSRSITTIHLTSTITNTIFATDNVTAASSAMQSSVMPTTTSISAAAGSGPDITFSPTPYSHGGSYSAGSLSVASVEASSVNGPSTVYVTVTETVPCGSAVASSDPITSNEISDPGNLTAIATGHSADSSFPLVSPPPPFPTTSSDKSVMANATAPGSNPISFQSPTFATTATIAIQTMTGGASSIVNTLSVQTATGIYIAGLTVLAYVAFMHGIGI